MSRLSEPCSLCGSPMGGYQYPRPGPVPGFWVVCTNDECGASVAGMGRHTAAEIERAKLAQSRGGDDNG